MPREKGGIGRTGKKHNSKSKFDVNRRLKDSNMPSSSTLIAPIVQMQSVEKESADSPT